MSQRLWIWLRQCHGISYLGNRPSLPQMPSQDQQLRDLPGNWWEKENCSTLENLRHARFLAIAGEFLPAAQLKAPSM
jgi:hypothetical protein